jgi:DNA repair ATPase RecN
MPVKTTFLVSHFLWTASKWRDLDLADRFLGFNSKREDWTVTARETLKASANASANARINEIRQLADESIAQIAEMKAAPEQIAAQLEPLAASLAALSTEVKASIKTLDVTVEKLPEAYAQKIKVVTEKAERSITSLYRTTMQVSAQANSVASYAKEIDQRQRRSMWRVAVVVGIFSAAPPTVICLAIALATGNPPLKLLKALVAM